jgi:hypothetical protein
MRRFSFWAAVLLVVVWHGHSYGQSHSHNPNPVQRIDLQAIGYSNDDFVNVAFCGPALLIWDRRKENALIDAPRRERLTGQPSQAGSCDTPLQDPSFYSSKNPHIVALRKQMVIEEVCDQTTCSQPPGSPAVRNVKYYLKRPGAMPVLLFQDHCLNPPPQFLGDEYALFFRCDLKSVVVNSDGKQVYQLPVFTFPYVVASGGGTRFAVYERDESLLHQLTDTIVRVRVSVFQTSNGKKLFKLGWHTRGESTRDGRIALSDDGLLLAVVRSGEALVFPVP